MSAATAACGSVLYLALVAALALGIATAVRDSAVAMGGVCALPLAPWQGLGVLALWAAGAMILGG